MSTSTTTAATGTQASGAPLLEVKDLTVCFPTYDGLVKAVTDLSFTVEAGTVLGIVGESGSGKSVSAMSILGLHDTRSAQLSGSIRFNGRELIDMPEPEMRKLRGSEISMVFQDALTALHPFYTVGAQIAESYRLHNRVTKKAARARAIEMLDLVGIPQPQSRVDEYPHQFSGGMRQRAMIAMALVNNPDLIICDEPTTALDVTVQAQILDLLQNLQREFNSAIIMITHDLGVIAELADEVLVMYAGRGVEYGSTKEVLSRPEMPYTWGLLSSVPDVAGASEVLVPIPGTPPSLLNPPTGCPFHPRCTYTSRVPGDLCRNVLPELQHAESGSPGHLKRCHLRDPEQIFLSELSEVVATAVDGEEPSA